MFKTTNMAIEVSCISQGDDLYAAACDFVRATYSKHFDCDLAFFFPHMIVMFNRTHVHLVGHPGYDIVGAVGYQVADLPLFLEQYLERPVEAEIGALTGHQPNRASLVEVGGFAVSSREHAMPLMLALAEQLDGLGLETVVCTASGPIRCCMAKAGLQTTVFGEAQPDKVDTSKNAWGRYYDTRPKLVFGDISEGRSRLQPKVASPGQPDGSIEVAARAHA